MGRQCIAAIPKPRKRRSTSGLSETESGRLSVSNLLSSTPDHSTTPTATSSFAPAPSQSCTAPQSRQHDIYRTSSSAQVDRRFDPRPAFSSLFAEKLGLSSRDVLPQDLLNDTNEHVVQDCLAAFQPMQYSGPFLTIPSNSDPFELVTRRPITTLAICIATLTAYPHKQDGMCRALRHALIVRRNTKGEPSVDEAMGLLIYLNWSHHHRADHSFYCDLHHLAALATEIGRLVGLDVETQRLLLGCYYLCSTLTSSDASRSNPLLWNRELERMLDQLIRSMPDTQDRSLIALVELARSSEELNGSLQKTMLSHATGMQNAAIDMYVIASQYAHMILVRANPDVAQCLALLATRVQTQAYALRSASPNDTNKVLETAVSIKDVIESVLSQPPISMHQMCIVDWTSLLAVLAFMVQLFIPSSSPITQWAAGPLHSTIQPFHVLDALATHMRSAPYNERNERLLRWFTDLTEAMKAKLNRDGRRTSAESSGGFRPVNQSQSPPVLATSRRQSGSVADPVGVFKPELLEDTYWDRFLNQ